MEGVGMRKEFERMTVCRLRPVEGVVGEGIKFERIRRITGYLVGTTDRFNNAKRAEEHDRVKHGFESFNARKEEQAG